MRQQGLSYDAYDRIAQLRHLPAGDRSDFVIGCRILAQPFFLPESEWIAPPASWAREIVSFKTYTTGDAEGAALWQQVQERVQRAQRPGLAAREGRARFGEPVLVAPRLGQGAFRVLVTDLYDRRCVVTGEKTLPALDAAHIRPYADGDGHEPSNGLLLRRDSRAGPVPDRYARGGLACENDSRPEIGHRGSTVAAQGLSVRAVIRPKRFM